MKDKKTAYPHEMDPGKTSKEECLGPEIAIKDGTTAKHVSIRIEHCTDPDEKEKLRAILAKDPDHDGLFCYGVKETGIVCKPSCPATKPKDKSIEWFDSPDEALGKGYRPCKICMKTQGIIPVQRYKAPCGELLLGSFGEKLCLCDWQTEKHRGHVDRRLQRMLHARFEEGSSKVIERATRQLDEYFAGKRREFDVPLLFIGTEFQKAVWNELLKIPFGATVSYGALSERLGMPKAVRAVANANGANSLSIFAPCHRVIGSDRSLTGYGGGLPAKRFLLELESGPQLAL